MRNTKITDEPDIIYLNNISYHLSEKSMNIIVKRKKIQWFSNVCVCVCMDIDINTYLKKCWKVLSLSTSQNLTKKEFWLVQGVSSTYLCACVCVHACAYTHTIIKFWLLQQIFLSDNHREGMQNKRYKKNNKDLCIKHMYSSHSQL